MALFALLGLLGALSAERALTSALNEDIEAELLRHARLGGSLSSEELVARVDELGEASELRFTLIRPDGVVLADSSADPSTMDNHANRPEIREAAGGQVGISRRFSDTVETEMLYVAIPHEAGVLRVSRPLDRVNARVGRIRLSLFLAGGLALLVAVATSAVTSHLITRELRVREEGEKLAHLAAVRRDFVSNVSHELKTPVAVLRASSEALLDGALEDERMGPRFAEAIHRHAVRLGDIIQDLLTLARVEAGQQEIHLQPVRLVPVVERTLEVLQPQAEAQGQDLSHAVPTEARVLADEAALAIVLSNLVGNAVTYAGAGARIRVQFLEGELRVLDDGPGVPEEHRDRIFERFYRVDPGRSREMGGTGLGLAIVRHLVMAMGGSIELVQSELGGAAFRVRLPTAPSPD